MLRKESKFETGLIPTIRQPLLCAVAVLVVSVLSVAAWMTTSHDKERALIAQAIWNHSHSLLVDHLLDVTATDQHLEKVTSEKLAPKAKRLEDPAHGFNPISDRTTKVDAGGRRR